MSCRPGNRIVRHRWTVYPPGWAGHEDKRRYKVCASRLQMKKALFEFGVGAEAEYDPVVRHRDGGVSWGWVCDRPLEDRHKKDCWVQTEV